MKKMRRSRNRKKIKCHEWVEVIEERDERKGKEDINRGQKAFN